MYGNNYGNYAMPNYSPAYAQLLRQKAWIEQQLSQMQQAKAGMPGGRNSGTLNAYEEQIKELNASIDMAAMPKAEL